ncbi:ComEA family DNA-binding protein [Flagellimonas meridianipacifica]|uniref:Competence ComEA-like helix-hairpin-helix protein n=1 Tax=Flagellimonas meridianipacifica TaxID=1080225 RepID=A0A2T0M6Y1_9FLAO|nr:helix-hairpin-helix domain-containing protein [Allomuricauda pacifica]PRX53135.1 competence ComEA-like helix-hairpin-helix protein [Allomuricauda pacifica]
MKDFKSHFRFTKQERNGIFFLVLLIVLLQLAYVLVRATPANTNQALMLDAEVQHQVDSLKQLAIEKGSRKIYPFNPNFISDYKGYTLGMSPKEIDRLFEFRKTGRYVNSATEFQEVTQVSDSLLLAISSYFKFPEWKQKNNSSNTYTAKDSNKGKQSIPSNTIIDLNKATTEQLREVYGVGEKLSARIVKFRDRLGGFLTNGQLYDVYGLESHVVEAILQRFQVLRPLPEIKKININNATATEIAQLVYIKPFQAKEIVKYREENGPLRSLNEMTNVFNVSEEKIDRIELYLSFKVD